MSQEHQFKSLAPVLLVEEIEPCVSFWRDKLGFTVVDEVREGGKLGFVILVNGDVTLMYQSRASIRKDIPALGEQSFHSATVLYVSVTDLDAVETLLHDVEKVVSRRKTFYGASEIGIREPGGTVILFSQHAAPEA